MATVSVTQPWTYVLELPRDPSALAVARATLRAVLTEHRMTELADEAKRLTSELIVGAPAHAGDTLRLRLRGDEGGRLQVSVGGHVVELPEPERHAASATPLAGCATCAELKAAWRQAEARCSGGDEAVHAGIALRRHFRTTHWLPQGATG
ncbi:hypothetical protein B7P34_24010 [Streptosporangium nondiastaticum]|uniref:ATP-binding protein n=1 Tax=Streptosporangium nondiastaticum TaxID=35764 RepID=A0A9X7JLZ4_9ACTN|nr:hypothetical protein [Streptosporangium nondiastaticum]PSJ26209.1 hypothetical protein B7P34_24010 [Streptosporangium nondiastaticum]